MRLKRQRAAWGDEVGASPRTPSCIAGNHNLSNNRRCKPSYFFWTLQGGWKRTLEAQGSSETKSHRAAHKQDAERAAQSEGTDENPVTIAHRPHESHPWGTQKLLFTCFEQSHHTQKLKAKPSTNTSLMVSLSIFPKNDGLPAKLSYSGLVFEIVHCKTLHPFPVLQFLVVSDCNPYLTKTSGDKK